MLFRQFNFYLYNEKTSIMSNYKLSKFQSSAKPQHSTHLSQVKLPALQARHQQQEHKHINKVKSNKLLAIQNRINSRYKSPLKNSHSVLSQLNHSRTPDFNMSNGFPENIGEQVNNIIKQNGLLNNEYYNSGAQNFQADILKNKEILKLQREKRELSLSKNQFKEQADKSPKQKKLKDNTVKPKRKSVNSNKKVNSRLNNASDSANANPQQKNSQNIFSSNSQLKIQNIEHKAKSKAQSSFNNKLEKRVRELKQKLSKRKINKREKMFTQGGVNQPQSQNLFDTIHNYLANPQRGFSNYKNINFKASLQEKRNQLQAQLRNLQKKQGNNSSEQRKGHKIVGNRNKNAQDESHWRKIELVPGLQINRQFLSVGESNFEKEMNHLGHLQQRNEYSLQRYIQHQRMLYDLKIMKSNSLKQNLRRQFLSK